jgi:hypothetical protein
MLLIALRSSDEMLQTDPMFFSAQGLGHRRCCVFRRGNGIPGQPCVLATTFDRTPITGYCNHSSTDLHALYLSESQQSGPIFCIWVTKRTLWTPVFLYLGHPPDSCFYIHPCAEILHERFGEGLLHDERGFARCRGFCTSFARAVHISAYVPILRIAIAVQYEHHRLECYRNELEYHIPEKSLAPSLYQLIVVMTN